MFEPKICSTISWEKSPWYYFRNHLSSSVSVLSSWTPAFSFFFPETDSIFSSVPRPSCQPTDWWRHRTSCEISSYVPVSRSSFHRVTHQHFLCLFHIFVRISSVIVLCTRQKFQWNFELRTLYIAEKIEFGILLIIIYEIVQHQIDLFTATCYVYLQRYRWALTRWESIH